MSDTLTAMDGIVRALDEFTYHSRPELSSTEARLLLDSPAKYRWRKDHPPLIAPSKKFDVGSAVHSKVLGTGYEVAVIPDEILASNGAASTTAAKAFIAQAREDGLIPLKQAELEPIDLAAESVMANPSARALFSQPGDAEVSVFAVVDGVPVRARFDFLPEQGSQRRVAVDLKTTVNASKQAFEKSVASYQYDVQRAWYLDALTAATGPMPAGYERRWCSSPVEKETPVPRRRASDRSAVGCEGSHEGTHRSRPVRGMHHDRGVAGIPTDVQLLNEPVWHIYEFEEKYSNE